MKNEVRIIINSLLLKQNKTKKNYYIIDRAYKKENKKQK